MSGTDPSPISTSSEAVQHHILGTAGHIDHGKTLLVRALTGIDTDRLPEEQRRGMTIELGFAELTIKDLRFGVVDVPGHERFVRMMVAGATGIDMALIVVAADDSVMPQTIEHVEILNLLGVRRGVVAITKTDLVEDELVELVAEEVSSLLAGTPFEHAPVCPVSSTTGAGLGVLRQAIIDVARDLGTTSSPPPFRLAVDRVFTVPGRGTVVTGSALRGTVAAGEALEVWPGGVTCRVRGLQSHGVQREALTHRQRVAINISGIDRQQVRRGSELATPGYLQPSGMLDVRLECLSSSARPLKSTSIVRLGIGTTEVPARVVLAEGGALQSGETACGQLRSGEPITATYGQRFIVRDEAATRTIGGGIVLRPIGRRKHRDAATRIEALRRLETGDAADRVEEVLRVAGFVTPTDLQTCARAGVELAELPGIRDRLRAEQRWVPVAGTGVHAVPAAFEDLVHRLTGWLERHHRIHPEQPGRHIDAVSGWLERTTNRTLARPFLDRLIDDRTLKLLGQYVCLPAFAPALSNADEKLVAAMLAEIKAGGFQPPALDSLSVSAQADRKRWDRLATLAVALGRLVQIDAKIYLDAEVERQLRATVADLITRHGGVTVAEVREALASSRKYVVPILEHLDRVGFTRRAGDRRLLAENEDG